MGIPIVVAGMTAQSMNLDNARIKFAMVQGVTRFCRLAEIMLFANHASDDQSGV
jgi:hypothetical protein